MIKIPFTSRTNGLTILVFGAVFLVLAICGVGYWQYVETQTLHLQERNFRALTVTGHALTSLVANYETVFQSVIEGEPPDQFNRQTAYKEALQALPSPLRNVKIDRASSHDLNGFIVGFSRKNDTSSIALTYVHPDRTKTTWKIEAELDIRTVMQQLVTEDIFSDVLLADSTMGKVLHHQSSKFNGSGFAFEHVLGLLKNTKESDQKASDEKQSEVTRMQHASSSLPLFNDVSVGGIAYKVFAQTTILPARPGTIQTLILVGIIPSGHFHAEARAIPLNNLLLMVWFLLAVFLVLPYVKLRTNLPTERLRPISVSVLALSTVLGTAALTFGLADVVTYWNMEQHLTTQLNQVSEDIAGRFDADLQGGLKQLAAFDESCKQLGGCKRRMAMTSDKPHCADRLHIGNGAEERFSFYTRWSNRCVTNKTVHDEKATVAVETNDVSTMLWIGPKGAIQAFWSREPAPWKRVTLERRDYVRRIWDEETLKSSKKHFWIQPIYSLTTGENSVVLSMKSTVPQVSDPDQPVVAALEVRLPSVTDAGVPPGMGFAVIDQEGQVLFHSDSRRNLRENFFEETDHDGRLRQAVFAHGADQFDGRYWGKDRHFHIMPLFRSITEPPDVHWSLVTYWDLDLLRFVNFRALFSSGALFLIYAIALPSIGLLSWWIASTVKNKPEGWMWPQPRYVGHYEWIIRLLLLTLSAVGLWSVRPHARIDMLVWTMMPLLGLVTVTFFFIIRMKSNPAHNTSADEPDWPACRRSYTLLLLLILLTIAVMPALVFFQAAVNVEWRLMAKFSQVDLLRDRGIQAQAVGKLYRQALFDEGGKAGEIRERFLAHRTHLASADPRYVYGNFPFDSCWGKCESHASSNGAWPRWINPPIQMRQTLSQIVDNVLGMQLRWDEFLIHTLYRVIDRPRAGHDEIETDMFSQSSTQWQEPAWGVIRLVVESKPDSFISVQAHLPQPLPEWLYSLLIFGGVIPWIAFQYKTEHASYVLIAAVSVVAGGFFWFGGIGLALAVLGICVVFYCANYALPRFAAQRVLLLDFPHAHPLMGIPQTDNVLQNERAGLDNVSIAKISMPSELSTYCQELLEKTIAEEDDVAKERIIRDVLKAATIYYTQIWKKCTESQRRSLFNLARDGFLHARNPDIALLMEKGLIVAGQNPRLMNESFRRFVVRTGVDERLDEDIAKAQASIWGQVWSPIGTGLVLVMVFLVMTQEQYRTVTGAFLTVLPGLLAALSQIMPSSKKENPETATSA